jgi:hypothetical protein
VFSSLQRDLLALKTARRLGLRCRVVLPFERRRFRDASVTDRPGHWGPLFDREIDAAAASGDLLVLETAGDGEAAYTVATDAILGEAHRLAGASGDAASTPAREILGVAVRDRESRGYNDLTARFVGRARARRITVEEISTL